ncbi:MAG: hypothetical protein M1837_003056 [Sclerophora amabilis]|nr:MAG: hypothetical protein M1837_003056 [Sclerophora amabilis]
MSPRSLLSCVASSVLVLVLLLSSRADASHEIQPHHPHHPPPPPLQEVLSPSHNDPNRETQTESTNAVVAGNTGARLCSSESDSDSDSDDDDDSLFIVDSVFSDPYPPRAGVIHMLEIKGTFRESFGGGAQLVASASSFDGNRSSFVERTEFCALGAIEQDGDGADEGNGGMVRCPPERGQARISHRVIVPPSVVESDRYSVQLSGETADGRRIFCLRAGVDVIGMG